MVDTTFATTKDEVNGKYLTTYEMIDILESHFPELNRSSNLNAELGKILRAKQFLFHKKKSGMTYLVEMKNKE